MLETFHNKENRQSPPCVCTIKFSAVYCNHLEDRSEGGKSGRKNKWNYKKWIALAGVAQMIRASSHKLKGHGFDSQSGHMPKVMGSISGWGAYKRQTIYVMLSQFSLSSLTSQSLNIGIALSMVLSLAVYSDYIFTFFSGLFYPICYFSHLLDWFKYLSPALVWALALLFMSCIHLFIGYLHLDLILALTTEFSVRIFSV